jgi:hypothetical protein
MKHKVYLHRRTDTGEIYYVGRGRGNRPRQFTRGRNLAWHKIYSRVGCEVEVIAEYEDEGMAAAHEQICIAMCRELHISIVNRKSGGFDKSESLSHTHETRKKQSVAALHRPPVSDATRMKMSAQRRGRPGHATRGTTGLRKYTNGVINKMFAQDPGPGWQLCRHSLAHKA